MGSAREDGHCKMLQHCYMFEFPQSKLEGEKINKNFNIFEKLKMHTDQQPKSQGNNFSGILKICRIE